MDDGYSALHSNRRAQAGLERFKTLSKLCEKPYLTDTALKGSDGAAGTTH